MFVTSSSEFYLNDNFFYLVQLVWEISSCTEQIEFAGGQVESLRRLTPGQSEIQENNFVFLKFLHVHYKLIFKKIMESITNIVTWPEIYLLRRSEVKKVCVSFQAK